MKFTYVVHCDLTRNMKGDENGQEKQRNLLKAEHTSNMSQKSS